MLVGIRGLRSLHDKHRVAAVSCWPYRKALSSMSTNPHAVINSDFLALGVCDPQVRTYLVVLNFLLPNATAKLWQRGQSFVIRRLPTITEPLSRASQRL